jgi:hypothetical protein
MKKIILISCSSKKLPYKAKAKEIYISPLFKLNMKYALSLKPDKIFILSAKYGLLDLEQEIEPYDLTLNNLKKEEINSWANKVLDNLKEEDLNNDEFIFLAGEKYRRFLIPKIENYKIPLKGLGIGKQLKFLKNKTREGCKEVHILFNNLKRFKFPFDNENIPKNGIYILFENNESGHGTNRIVRIGTHTGDNQLFSRLNQHFLNENKDRSIFRKNIGRAILNKRKDPFLKEWELDLTTKEAKDNLLNSIDLEKQKQIEKEVTKHIQDNFSFIVFPIEDKKRRLEIESKIISTISSCKDCEPSEDWFGLFSPKEKIRKSGLWLVNELYKEPLNEKDLIELKSLIKSITDNENL